MAHDHLSMASENASSRDHQSGRTVQRKPSSSRLPLASSSSSSGRVLRNRSSSREPPESRLPASTPAAKPSSQTLKRTFNQNDGAHPESALKRPAHWTRTRGAEYETTTPAPSRHLAPLPPSTIRSAKAAKMSEPELVLLAHDKARELAAQLDLSQTQMLELEREKDEHRERVFVLERKLLELESESRELLAQLERRDKRVKTLEQDRKVVDSQLETEEQERRKAIEAAQEEAKASKATTQSALEEVKKLKEINSTLEQRVRLSTHNEARAQQVSSDAQVRIRLLEDEKENSSKEALQLRRQLEEEQAECEKLRKEKQALQATRADSTPHASREVLSKELNSQIDRFKSMEQTNARLTRELTQLKSHHSNIELLKEENYQLKQRLTTLDELRKQLAATEVELSKLSHERSEWSIFIEKQQKDFTSPHEFFKCLATTRIENVSLKARLGSRESEIKSRDRMIGELESRLEEVEKERDEEFSEKVKAQGQVQIAERNRDLDRRRIQMLNEQLKSYTAEEKSMLDGAGFDEQKNLVVANLEELLEGHQKELARAQQEAAELRQRLEAQPVSMEPDITARSPEKSTAVKASLAEQIDRNEALETELDELADENEMLKMEMKSLELQVHRLERDLGRGEYNQNTIQVLCPEGSPVQQDYAIRTATLDALRAENNALLRRLGKLEKGVRQSGEDCSSLVPRESLVSQRHEISRLEGEVAKQTKARERLCEMYKDTTTLYKRAMWEILGYSLEAVANGEFRLRSAFKDENHATMLFVPGKGDGGSMEYKPSSHPFHQSPEVVNSFKTWVVNRQSLPCFTAALTLELYESTTRGQSAGYRLAG